MAQTTGCRGCGASVRIPATEVDRLVAEYLASHPGTVVDDAGYARRMALCARCDALQYGTTCRYCGCLVAIRAKLADKPCPAPEPRW